MRHNHALLDTITELAREIVMAASEADYLGDTELVELADTVTGESHTFAQLKTRVGIAERQIRLARSIVDGERRRRGHFAHQRDNREQMRQELRETELDQREDNLRVRENDLARDPDDRPDLPAIMSGLNALDDRELDSVYRTVRANSSAGEIDQDLLIEFRDQLARYEHTNDTANISPSDSVVSAATSRDADLDRLIEDALDSSNSTNDPVED
jgi:hypothetical protein